MKKFASFMTGHSLLVVLPLLASALSPSLIARESTDAARQALISGAEQYVATQLAKHSDAEIRANSMPVDERIQIPTCASPLQMSASDEALRQSNVTVRASCADNDWYLYLIVRVMEIQPVVVLSQAVSPGTVLGEQHLAIVERDKKTIRGSTFSDTEQLIGARIKRRTRAGQPVVPHQLCFVCKGDKIQISADIQGLLIRTSGVAQQDGNLGETIAVRNSSSQKLVRARVIDNGQVEVSI